MTFLRQLSQQQQHPRHSIGGVDVWKCGVGAHFLYAETGQVMRRVAGDGVLFWWFYYGGQDYVQKLSIFCVNIMSQNHTAFLKAQDNLGICYFVAEHKFTA